MISGSMKVLVDKSAAMSAMFTEGKRLKAELGEEHVFDFGIGNPNVEAPSLVNASMIEILKEMDTLDVHSYTNSEGIELKSPLPNSVHRKEHHHDHRRCRWIKRNPEGIVGRRR